MRWSLCLYLRSRHSVKTPTHNVSSFKILQYVFWCYNIQAPTLCFRRCKCSKKCFWHSLHVCIPHVSSSSSFPMLCLFLSSSYFVFSVCVCVRGVGEPLPFQFFPLHSMTETNTVLLCLDPPASHLPACFNQLIWSPLAPVCPVYCESNNKPALHTETVPD